MNMRFGDIRLTDTSLTNTSRTKTCLNFRLKFSQLEIVKNALTRPYSNHQKYH